MGKNRRLIVPLFLVLALLALTVIPSEAHYTGRRHRHRTPTPTPTPIVSPTPTATATPVSGPTTTGKIPVGYTIADTSPVVDFTVDGDQGIVMVNRTDKYKLWSVVPERARGVAVTTVANLDQVLANLPYRVGWVVYDIENWDLTPTSEQADPVGATRLARAAADRYGARLAVVPTLSIGRQYGEGMAKYAHVFKLQSKALQASVSPEQFGATLNPIYDRIRASNPAILVYADISPSPKGIDMTPQQMLSYWQAVAGHAQGVSAWVTNSEDEARFGQFLDLIGR